MNKKLYWLVCFIVVIFGFLIRSWGIWQGSFAFTYDVGRDLLAVRDLVVNHKFSLIGPTSGQMGIFYGPWWYWFLTIPYIIFGGNPVLITTFIAVFGMVGVVLAFVWGDRIKKPAFGIILGMLMAFLPYIISNTSQIWSPDLLPTMIIATLILLSQWEHLSKYWLVVLGFILMLCFESEMVFGAIFIFLIAIGLVIVYKKEVFNKKILYCFLGMLIVEIPRFVFDLRHQFLQAKTLFHLFSTDSQNTIYTDIRLNLFLEKLKQFMPSDNIFLLGVCIAVVIYLFVKNKKLFEGKIKYFLIILVFQIIGFFIFTMFYQKDVWEYYLLGLPVIIAVFLSYILGTVLSQSKNKLWIIPVIVYLLLILSPQKLISTFTKNKFIGNASVYRNQLEIVDYIYQEAGGADFNVTPYTPPQIEYTWRYLFSWYGKNKYGYEPKLTRSERLYLIIEPDPGYEGRITMWLKVRENDGKTFKTKEFPSGITVQSRARPKEE